MSTEQLAVFNPSHMQTDVAGLPSPCGVSLPQGMCPFDAFCSSRHCIFRYKYCRVDDKNTEF